MPRTRAVTISRPYDARHVAGVAIPGTSVPKVDAPKAFSIFEPDERPTHMNMSLNTQTPKRPHTIAHSLSRPSLRLKSSISRLRGRSTSHSPESSRNKERESTPEPRASSEPPQLPELGKLALDRPRLEQKTSQHFQVGGLVSSRTVAEKKPPPPTRPKRAESGTAINFDDVPVEGRPLGFKEILAVKSLEERMALYKKTRDYWASTDHGLEEWMGRAGVRRIALQV